MKGVVFPGDRKLQLLTNSGSRDDISAIARGGNTPEAYARLIAAEVEKWKKVVAATGVKAE